jgi:hypothetical protein
MKDFVLESTIPARPMSGKANLGHSGTSGVSKTSLGGGFKDTSRDLREKSR